MTGGIGGLRTALCLSVLCLSGRLLCRFVGRLVHSVSLARPPARPLAPRPPSSALAGWLLCILYSPFIARFGALHGTRAIARKTGKTGSRRATCGSAASPADVCLEAARLAGHTSEVAWTARMSPQGHKSRTRFQPSDLPARPCTRRHSRHSGRDPQLVPALRSTGVSPKSLHTAGFLTRVARFLTSSILHFLALAEVGPGHSAELLAHGI